MAKNLKKVDKPDKANGKRAEDDAPPGFDEVVTSSSRADGWAKKGEGFVIQGRLISRTTMREQDRDGKRRSFYTIELQAKAAATTGKGDDVEDVTLEPGDLINVDESAALEDLEPRTRDGGVYDVWIKYGKQQESSKKGQKGFWPATIRLRTIKPATRAVMPRDQREARRDSYDDDRYVDRSDRDYRGRPTRDRNDDIPF